MLRRKVSNTSLPMQTIMQLNFSKSKASTKKAICLKLVGRDILRTTMAAPWCNVKLSKKLITVVFQIFSESKGMLLYKRSILSLTSVYTQDLSLMKKAANNHMISMKFPDLKKLVGLWNLMSRPSKVFFYNNSLFREGEEKTFE